MSIENLDTLIFNNTNGPATRIIPAIPVEDFYYTLGIFDQADYIYKWILENELGASETLKTCCDLENDERIEAQNKIIEEFVPFENFAEASIYFNISTKAAEALFDALTIRNSLDCFVKHTKLLKD